MDFINGKELLQICRSENKKISRVMLEREVFLGSRTEEEVLEKLKVSLGIMKKSAHGPIENPVRSLGGLIGGEGKKITDHASEKGSLLGSMLTRAIAYGMAVLEVNGTMGLIVAAPTAGSSGIVPGCLISYCEEYGYDDSVMLDGLLNTSAIGYLLTRNASVSGAEAGCQAEVGAASAMAASALTELQGGTAEMCLHAASIAMSNLLGLVCDPIAGLVEAPCQSRNAIGVSNAFTCAQLALSGIAHPIPFDEMAEAMYRVGCSLPFELRETALGGNASTPTGCTLCNKCK